MKRRHYLAPLIFSGNFKFTATNRFSPTAFQWI